MQHWMTTACSAALIICFVGCDMTPLTGDGQGVVVTPVSRQAAADGPVVLMKFGATWCGPCREIEKELDKIEPELTASGVDIRRIDVTRERGLAEEYGVRNIPLLVLKHGDRVVDQQVGYQTSDQLRAWVTRYGLPQSSATSGTINTNPFTKKVSDTFLAE